MLCTHVPTYIQILPSLVFSFFIHFNHHLLVLIRYHSFFLHLFIFNRFLLLSPFIHITLPFPISYRLSIILHTFHIPFIKHVDNKNTNFVVRHTQYVITKLSLLISPIHPLSMLSLLSIRYAFHVTPLHYSLPLTVS